jgi:hypothetical protein
VQRIGTRRIGGSDNYLRSRQAFVPPDVLQDSVAGDMGKVKIEDDQLWAECCQLLQGSRAIVDDRCFKSRLAQRFELNHRQLVVIFNDERQRVVVCGLGHVVFLSRSLVRPASN